MTDAAARGPRVAVFSLGGTIAMAGDGPGGVVPALSGAELLAAIPGLADAGIDVDVHDFRAVPSASLGFDDVLTLAAAIKERLAEGADGIVVTQGTDTIEETAYLLDLLHDHDAPLVVTGAMRNPTMAGADGPANMLAAVQVAASGAARGLGCVVVFADQIHAAQFVRKTHSTSITAFTSPGFGPLGHLAEGEPQVLTRRLFRLNVEMPWASARIRVPVLPMALGDDGETFKLLGEHIDGLVVAGFGVGHVPAAAVEPLAELARRMPVILASRTGAGPVLRRTYGYPGSESDLLDRGLISAGILDPYKARILLRTLIAVNAGRKEIAAAFQSISTASPSP